MADCYRPENLEEAISMRLDGAIPFAGGTDLMVAHRGYTGTLPKFPAPLLFTSRIAEMRKLESSEEGIIVGAAVTLTELCNYRGLPKPLGDALRQIAAPGLRNMATLGGNICNASPAGDSLVPLYMLDAELQLCGPEGSRTLPIEKFITGVRKSALGEGELLVEIRIPRHSFTTTLYKKVGTRRANALSKLSISAAATLDSNRVVRDLRIALGAVSPVVVRSRAEEGRYGGVPAGELDPEEIRDRWCSMITPIDDQRSTALYRQKVAGNLIYSFVELIK